MQKSLIIYQPRIPTTVLKASVLTIFFTCKEKEKKKMIIWKPKQNQEKKNRSREEEEKSGCVKLMEMSKIKR